MLEPDGRESRGVFDHAALLRRVKWFVSRVERVQEHTSDHDGGANPIMESSGIVQFIVIFLFISATTWALLQWRSRRRRQLAEALHLICRLRRAHAGGQATLAL